MGSVLGSLGAIGKRKKITNLDIAGLGDLLVHVEGLFGSFLKPLGLL